MKNKLTHVTVNLQNVERIDCKYQEHDASIHLKKWATLEFKDPHQYPCKSIINMFFDGSEAADYARDIAIAINTVNQRYERKDKERKEHTPASSTAVDDQLLPPPEEEMF